MKLVGLISGGKDSVYNMLQCIAAGHEMVALANIEPYNKEELDSYMYQSVGHQAISLIAGALVLPIYRQKTKGLALCKDKTYEETGSDEVEDLLELLKKVKKEVSIDGVSVGAIASDYQRTRVESVCRRLGLICFAYLWRRNQEELLHEMINCEVDAIIVKVASIGLVPETHLGMHIKDIMDHLKELNEKYGVSICGEGGEYETLTIDSPLFQKSITILESENVVLSNDAFAPVAFLNVKNANLKYKPQSSEDPVLSLQTRLDNIRSTVRNPYDFVQDCVDDISHQIFPQRPNKSTLENLPFPFERQSDARSTFSEYWKKLALDTAHSSQTIPIASPSHSHWANSNLNYSTGWCSLGNIIGANFTEAFSSLQKQLNAVHYEFKDIVFLSLYVKDMSDFKTMNKLYSKLIGDNLPPARVCVETVLPPEVSAIICVQAHRVVSRSQKVLYATYDSQRDGMYVQSISHWAPASIGPYSQCVKVGGLFFVSGQIPLIPGTMEVLNKPLVHQSRLTLRHVLRILQAMDSKLDFSSILQGICYVTSEEMTADVISLWSYITKNQKATITVVTVPNLPKKAQMEWEILACNFENPKADQTEITVEDYSLQMERCFYTDPFTSSVVCKVSHLHKVSKHRKHLKSHSFMPIQAVLKHFIHYLRTDSKVTGTPLCVLKLFYKASESAIGTFAYDLSKTLEHKVIVTGIPVVACQGPDVFLTITGICH